MVTVNRGVCCCSLDLRMEAIGAAATATAKSRRATTRRPIASFSAGVVFLPNQQTRYSLQRLTSFDTATSGGSPQVNRVILAVRISASSDPKSGQTRANIERRRPKSLAPGCPTSPVPAPAHMLLTLIARQRAPDLGASVSD